ncbi:class I SAM-dependent methyltransferase [Saccharomonospora halophila]|uniref:class I SAM-dependent methyltransferase n=1 Tax=Saccharomonospora halophila TaxID=129922 RepID=UPI000368B932|nr:class I SAM-dependent methyltransferase [Saccharomonospora halophila]
MPGHRIFAAMYDRMAAPVEKNLLGPRREGMLSGVTGRVLDVGAGTGVNLDYLRNAEQVVLTEPDPAMRAKLERKLGRAHAPVVQVSDAAAEELPFDDDSFDAVVCTLVLCTVADPARALAEARRVLRPEGTLYVLEHVRGEGAQARWQDRVTPLWKRLGAGCHPNRDTRTAVEHAGFTFTELENLRAGPRWIPASPLLQGTAHPTG